MTAADTVIILDFETTGLSPECGDRAIEIGAVRLDAGQVSGRFQALMNPGRRINTFIESYTGISNIMLQEALPCREVMQEFAEFIAGYNLVAHNAAFDKRFLDAELRAISRSYQGEFACSMLMARRLYQDAANHQLGTLIKHTDIVVDGVFHRALYDSEMTAKLWLRMLQDMSTRYQLQTIPFTLTQRLARMPKKSVHSYLQGLQRTGAA